MILATILAVCAIIIAFAPQFLDAYGMGVMIGLLSYVTLATAWSMFSGPTRYVSLATVAFFGLGAYTVAVLNEVLPWWLILICVALIGASLALIVGLSTLRVAGIYFVIFSFGLAELIRQLITWYEVNITGTLGRYIFLPFESHHILWQLLALCIVTVILSVVVDKSRLGLALKAIGDDELVASHVGINLARSKLMLFVLSATLITLVGAIQSPRWVYIEPSIVFNPQVSFLTVIMALLGGANRRFGPILGAVPLFLLFEWLGANFPNSFSVILGVLFILIVFAFPDGVLAGFDRFRRKEAVK